MPIKHQSRSYRNRDGERYVCWGDYDTSQRDTMNDEVKQFRKRGIRAFAEHHKDGYSRVFIHEEQAHRSGILKQVADLP